MQRGRRAVDQPRQEFLLSGTSHVDVEQQKRNRGRGIHPFQCQPHALGIIGEMQLS